jgi:hypothetical protein
MLSSMYEFFLRIFWPPYITVDQTEYKREGEILYENTFQGFVDVREMG